MRHHRVEQPLLIELPSQHANSSPGQRTVQRLECPYCCSKAVYKSRSKSRSVFWLLRPFLLYVRCHNCQRSFLRRTTLTGGTKVRRSRKYRKKRWLPDFESLLPKCAQIVDAVPEHFTGLDLESIDVAGANGDPAPRMYE